MGKEAGREYGVEEEAKWGRRGEGEKKDGEDGNEEIDRQARGEKRKRGRIKVGKEGQVERGKWRRGE